MTPTARSQAARSAALSCLVVALAMVACGSKQQPEEASGIGAGDPYTGFIEVQVQPAGGRGWKRYGEGSAHFVDNDGGNARLVVFGATDDGDGDAGFAVDGTFGEDGWRSESDGVVLEIARDGRISGGGTIHPQRFGFSGLATPTTFSLDVDLELLEPGSPQLPAGSVFRFSYDLSRPPPRDDDEPAEAMADGRDADRKCRRIRYEMRPVANIGDGSMSMIQVPVCLE